MENWRNEAQKYYELYTHFKKAENEKCYRFVDNRSPVYFRHFTLEKSIAFVEEMCS